MVCVKPFKGIRPNQDVVGKLISPPYDVLNREDIAALREQSDYSFVRVSRAEVDLPKLSPYDDEVYEASRARLEEWLEDGVLVREERDSIYLYEEEFMGHVQRGYVLICDVDDYKEGKIARHELTLKAKEEDRINHFLHCKMQTEPVFLFAKTLEIPQPHNGEELLYDERDASGVRHRLWKIDDSVEIGEIQECFQAMDKVYIADGHHRTASAARVSDHFAGSGIMSVVFPAEELNILPYHRLIKGLEKMDWESWMPQIEKNFAWEEKDWKGETPLPGHFYLVAKDRSYFLRFKGEVSDDIVENLDASRMQNHILGPIFQVENPREDERLDFIGGLDAFDRMMDEVDKGALALVMPATSIEDIKNVADHHLIMPPKSTWFEPKLISGMFLYEFE